MQENFVKLNFVDSVAKFRTFHLMTFLDPFYSWNNFHENLDSPHKGEGDREPGRGSSWNLLHLQGFI